MKYIKKIIGAILIIVIGLVLTLNIYNFINIKILKKDLSTVFGYSVLEVVSGSMEPTIKVGQLIIIDTNQKTYKPGDIVTFYDTNGSFVTHRIVSINEKEMITKGDNNDSKDEPTKTNKIVGKYIFKFNYLGQIINFFKNPLVLILILIIGTLYAYLISDTETKEKIKEVAIKVTEINKNKPKKKNNNKKKKKRKQKKKHPKKKKKKKRK